MSTSRILRRFDIFTYKNKSGSDAAQVPTAATVGLYRQGASSTSAITFSASNPGPYAVPVGDIGDILAGDAVQAGTDASKNFTVDSVVGRTTLNLLNDLGLNFTASAGTRFMLTTIRPTFFSDPLGVTSLGSSITADATTGRAQAYVRDKRFDYVVSGTVSPARIHVDAEGGSIPENYVNVRDFPTVQAALDALGSRGGTVFIPEGSYDATTMPAFVPPLVIPEQPAPINIVGEGPTLSLLHANASSADMVLIRSSWVHVTGIGLRCESQLGSGRGFVIGPTANVIGGVTLTDCEVYRSASWGLHVIGGDPVAGPLSIWGEYLRVRILEPRSNGGILIDRSNTTQFFVNCSVVGFLGHALFLDNNLGAVFDRCTFEDSRNTDGNFPYVAMKAAFSVAMRSCWFEHHTDRQFNRHFIELGVEAVHCGNITIDTCMFVHQSLSSARIVSVMPNCKQIEIRNPRVALNVAPTTTDDIALGTSVSAQIIGGEIATPLQFYPLRISDDEQNQTYLLSGSRLRIPRLTTAVRDSLPDRLAGDVVYDRVRDRLGLFGGAAWQDAVVSTPVDLLSVASPIASTPLISAPPADLYRVTAALLVRTPKPLVQVTVRLSWRDENGPRTTDLIVAPLDSVQTFTGLVSLRAIVGSPPTALSYETIHSGPGGIYDLYLRAERA